MEISKAFIATFVVLVGTIASCHCNLPSSAVRETPCFGPPLHTSLATWEFVFSYTGIWNLPMASKYYYRKYAEVMLQRPAADEDELAQMNLQAKCVANACNLTGFSYTKRVTEICVATAFSLTNPALITQFTCPNVGPPLSSEDTDWQELNGHSSLFSYAPPQQFTVIDTDLINYVILGACLDGVDRAFAVFSKTESLTQDEQDNITATLVAAGYNSANFQNL